MEALRELASLEDTPMGKRLPRRGKSVILKNISDAYTWRVSAGEALMDTALEVENDEKVDMREGTSFTLPKATPLEVVLTPRLSPHQYR